MHIVIEAISPSEASKPNTTPRQKGNILRSYFNAVLSAKFSDKELTTYRFNSDDLPFKAGHTGGIFIDVLNEYRTKGWIVTDRGSQYNYTIDFTRPG